MTLQRSTVLIILQHLEAFKEGHGFLGLCQVWLYKRVLLGRMGAGGDASGVAPQRFERTRIGKVKEDLTCLKSMWFDKVNTSGKMQLSAQNTHHPKTILILPWLSPASETCKPVGGHLVARLSKGLEVNSGYWLKVKGADHAARLESFYGPQAHACESLLVFLCRGLTMKKQKQGRTTCV
jgi:hypothetical protein